MARPGLLTHRKFIRLARLIRSDALAYGHLGIIWDACYEAGDDNVGSSEDLEYLARWQGEAGKLSSALVESGFIDEDAGIHRVHDLYDHAPDYVQKRMEREHQRRAKGVTISELRAKAGRASGEARRKQTAASDEQTGTNGEQVLNTCRTHGEQTGTNGATPAPSAQHPVLGSGVPEPLSPEGDPSSNGDGKKPKEIPRGLSRLIELWNQIDGVQPCRDPTPKRIASYQQRSKRETWMNSVKPALQKVAASAFCRGHNDRGWLADIDWFLKPDTVTRICEGKYDDRNQPTRVANIPAGGNAIFNAETGEIVIRKESP